MSRRNFYFPVLSGWLFAIAALTADAQQFGQTVQTYCVGCHNSKTKAGNIALDQIHPDDAASHPEIWEKVVRKLRARSMPPAGIPRPDEATYNALASSLESTLDKASAEHPHPGHTDTFRRLTRTEYQNSIRDFLALDVDVSNLLPVDESSHGFDNVTVGDLSPTLLDRYLSAARKIARLAVGTPVQSPDGQTVTLPPDLTQEEHLADQPLGTRGGTSFHYTFPRDGEYELRIRLQRDRNEHVEGLKTKTEVEILLDGERVKLFTVEPPPTGVDHHLVDHDLGVRIQVKAGPHVVAAAFPKMPSILLETERQPYQAHFNNDRHPRITPAVYTLAVTGPFQQTGPGDTPTRRRLFVCQPTRAADQSPCAQRILETVMRRAYRRPVLPADLSRPIAFFKEGNKESGFDTGIEMALSAVLVSPEFLFRLEQTPAGAASGQAYKIPDLELASRLSFFLWSSIPDDELLAAAIAGKLKDPVELERQTRRMLSDPRSKTLVGNFAGQWLYLRNLASTNPDMRLFPDFDDNLRQAFRTETEMFVDSILRRDGNVVDLLSANYTFVNERLAKHYGIPNIYGSRFRRVDFPESGERGGLLRQGSILTVTSYATRTSPVIRGKWILDNLLGSPPPPPPPAVPALKENASSGKNLPMRARLAEHRVNPACSGCHQLMDPVGFSLENYDAIGRWRTTEAGKAVDVAGGLPDGSKFDGVAGLRAALLSRPEIFVGTFTSKLLTYALGRGVEYYDEPAVRKIVRDAAKQDYRFSAIVTGIVTSTPFGMRSTQ